MECLQAQLMQVKAQLAQNAMNPNHINSTQYWQGHLSGLFPSFLSYPSSSNNPISPQSSLDSVEVELHTADNMNMQELQSLQDFSFHGYPNKTPCDSDLGELQAIALRMMRN